jgi:hypothetical protein
MKPFVYTTAYLTNSLALEIESPYSHSEPGSEESQ